MIALGEAQARLIALAKPVSSETVPLAQAKARWLAADLVSKRTQPARNLSAMDGYAVRASARRSWRVIGESAAGKPFNGQIGDDEAVRIFTGGALPTGSNSIVIQENIILLEDVVTLLEDVITPSAGHHVRARGTDFTQGERLIAAGTQINPAKIALAAMGGHGSVLVRRPIRIALISTGDELVAPGEEVDEDHIPASNAIMLAAMLGGWPVEINDIGIVPDTLDALKNALQLAVNSDIIVTTGGASVGDHDLVRPALLAAGASLDFWKVAMRPGKPLMAGVLGDSLVIGLPGNPVSAFVTAILFVKPAIAALSGAVDPLPHTLTATLGASMAAVGPRTDHIRAQLRENRLFPIGIDDSAILMGLAKADALIVRDAGEAAANAGDLVQFIPLA